MRLQQTRKALHMVRDRGLAGFARRVLAKWSGRNSIHEDSPIPESWTPYMSWLMFANAGMLKRGNVSCFDYAISHLPSQGAIVEIGSFCGLSTNMIAYLKERHERKNPLVTCDKWMFEGADPAKMVGDSRFISHADYRAFVKETFLRNVSFFSRSDLPYTIELLSDEFFAAWQARQTHTDVFGREFQLGGPIAFCYIDGNHSYECARRDYENADQYLLPGGFLLFDDSADGSKWEVCKVVQEVLSTGRYALVSKNPNYFFRKP